jgi:hypothetical protein
MANDGYDEILFRTVSDTDWSAFKLMEPMQLVDLTRFQGRVITGAPDKTSNPLLSTWVISDLMGGHGVDRIKVGTDQNRYRYSSLYARIPGQLAMPRFRHNEAGPNTDGARPLGDLYVSGTYRFYAAFGTAVCKWDESGSAFGASLGALTAVPVNKAVEFVGTGSRFLFVPCGSSGYSTVSTADAIVNTAAGASDPAAQALCVWDDKLIAIDTAGQLWYTTSGAAASWTSYGTTGKLDASFIPRHLCVYYDRQDNPCIHVVTNRGVWAFDPAGPRLYLTEVEFPMHPQQGRGVAKWRGSMYTANGMGVTQYTGNVVNPGVGLDRDDGLLDDFRGYIVDLQAEYNGLYALVAGSASGTDNWVSVHVWTGFGWHAEYNSIARSALAKLTWMQVSQAQGGYRLWWGEGGNMSAIVLPTDFANPRALTSAGTGNFVNAAGSIFHHFQSGRFDADMENYVKVANTLEIKIDSPTDVVGAVWVDYRKDGATSYTNLTQDITAEGTYVVPFGTALAGGSGYSGISFYDIEIRLRVLAANQVNDSTPNTKSLVIEYIALTYRQIIPAGASWTAMVDLQGPHNGKSPETMRAKLDALLNYAGFFEMMHRGTVYRVCFSQLAGRDETGRDTRGTRQLNILEVPSTGIAGSPTIV